MSKWEVGMKSFRNNIRFLLAFTLAEVLITLGIIGVVAAMTIPTLMTKIQEHQTVSKLKETYSILSQAIRLVGEDQGYPEEWGISGRDARSGAIVAEKLKPYLKIAVDCGMANEGNTNCFAEKLTTLNGQAVYNTKNSVSKYLVSLLNGTSVVFEGAASDGLYMYFLVDINGKSKPNIWGVDIFEFSYKEGIGLVPSGHPQNTSNTYKKFCKDMTSTGYGCAYYVLHFGKMDYLNKK